ncbi:MAG: hypothetical protein F6K21_10810 [Symploca sp. SIO2D2]|nr:hypothetical protein [Symploca sp. SIO2D2]
MPLRFPSDRHFLSGLSIPKAAGNSIFLIEKSLVQNDVNEINSGQATREDNTFTTSSGRIYSFHYNILYPIEGPGIVKVPSQKYKLLKQFKQNKDKAMQTMNILVTKEIISSDRADLIKEIAQNSGSIS